jgi:hypothetical protein
MSFSDAIGKNGSTTELFVYANASVIGIPARTRCMFKGDADHLGNRSPGRTSRWHVKQFLRQDPGPGQSKLKGRRNSVAANCSKSCAPS